MDRETLARTLDHDSAISSLAVSRMMSDGKVSGGKEIVLDKKRNFYET
jgi:hypothetical protein